MLVTASASPADRPSRPRSWARRSVGTDAVLDVLARHHVPATSFVVGRDAERAPHLVRRIIDEGPRCATLDDLETTAAPAGDPA